MITGVVKHFTYTIGNQDGLTIVLKSLDGRINTVDLVFNKPETKIMVDGLEVKSAKQLAELLISAEYSCRCIPDPMYYGSVPLAEFKKVI